MRADATGSAYESRGKFYIVVSTGGGKRHHERMPSATSLDEARARAAIAAELVAALTAAGRVEYVETAIEQVAQASEAELEDVRAVVGRIVGGTWTPAKKGAGAAPGTLTFGKVADMYTSGELAKLYPDDIRRIGERTMEDYQSKLRDYVLPHVKDVPIASFGLEHARDVMRHIDESARKVAKRLGRKPETTSAATRRHVAFNIRHICELAVYPLGAIKANPIPRNFMPRPAPPKARGFIYPDEEAKLLGLDATSAPLVDRLLVGVLAREGMRKDEAATLEWGDVRRLDAAGWVDLDRGWIHIEKHKTQDVMGPKRWPLAADTLEALKRWRKANRAARYVFERTTVAENGRTARHPLAVADLPERLRRYLVAAGITRAELHTTTATRRKIKAHDLRGVFVTMALVQGKSEDFISRRTGHKSSAMIRHYRAMAENLSEGAAVSLTPLHEAIPELRGAVGEVSAEGAKGSEGSGNGGDKPAVARPLTTEKAESHSGGRAFDPRQLHR